MGLTRLTDGRFIDVNRAFEELSGYSRDELVGRTSVEAGLWVEAEDRAGIMEELRQHGSIRHTEHRLRRKTGEVVLLDYALSVLDLDHDPCVFGVATDVTETYRARSLMETVIEHAPIILFALDGEGMLTLAEGSALESFGVDPSSVVGRPIAEMYPDPVLMEQFTRLLSGEEIRSVVRVGGRVIDVFCRPLMEAGSFRGAVGVATDITDPERARRDLQLVVSNAPIVFFAMDANGVFTLSEGAALGALGLRPGEVVGRSAFELYAGDPEVVAQLHRVLGGEEFRSLVRSGDLVFDVFWSPVKDSETGEVAGATGVATDVTEVQRAQEGKAHLWGHLVRMQEGERARIANDLHDGPIQQMAALQLRLAALHDLLPDSPLPSQLEGTLEECLAGLRRMVTELRPSTLDRLGLAAAIDADLHALNAELGMAVEIDDDDLVEEPDADTAITAYRATQQALSNVRAHARASSVHVRLSTHEAGLLVRVRDDGVGFDPVPGEPGHIGLPSTREQIELAGGWLRVLSTPGGGTTVEFWLPSTVEPDTA
jgi:PAS domain S-box-containing protein